MRVIFVHELSDRSSREQFPPSTIPVRRLGIHFAFHAAIVVAAAIYLPEAAARIADATGLGRSFVGTALVAFSTSMPELVISISALRMGAIDLAFGNIFGSNLFNIAILAVDDFFLTDGPLLSLVHPEHAITGLSAVAMTSLAMAGLARRPQRKRGLLSWELTAVSIMYVVNLVFVYSLRSG